MSWLVRGLTITIGRKMIVAITGAGLLVFVVVHMLGNLQVFLGRETYNDYAATLKDMGALLWVARGGLVLFAVVHVVTALQLARKNVAARPERYAVTGRIQASPASRSMTLTGVMILLFVLYHLAHFTLGFTNPEHFALADEAGRHDVYAMFVLGFRLPVVTVLYVAAMALLALHLSHGFQSTFQTLGFHNPRYVPALRRTSVALAWAIFVGNAIMPLAVLAGLVGADVAGG